MVVTEWIKNKVPDFGDLSEEEVEAIKDFLLLWSLYEGEVLATAGSANKIVESIERLGECAALTLAPFDQAIAYFRGRYYREGEFTSHFYDLQLRKNDRPDLVRIFLNRSNENDSEIISALLIIVLRLRNNLFHGTKWRYGIKGQLDNFRQANAVLMTIMEIHRNGTPA